LLCDLIAEPTTTTSEALGLVRALDFQDQPRMLEALRRLVKTFAPAAEKRSVILPELVIRLAPADGADPELATRIDEAAGFVTGTRRFVELAQRFRRTAAVADLLTLATADTTDEQLASAAAGALLDLGGEEAAKLRVAGADAAALRLLTAIGIHGSGRGTALLAACIANADTTPQIRTASVQALARSNRGAKDVVALAKAGGLTGQLPQVAAVAIASCPWADVRQAAADVLPMPKAKEGALPPVADLMKRGGDVTRGKAVFAGAGTCAKCHVVGAEGKSVGPNLSGIGAKLSKPALYEAILAPSAAISHNYETHTAVLDDGRSVTGLLVSQSPAEVVIRGADGIDMTTPASEIAELVKQPVSLMPADLAATLSAQELVDLVAWLETLKQAN
jgi:putative heme-binding domain-containing protein